MYGLGSLLVGFCGGLDCNILVFVYSLLVDGPRFRQKPKSVQADMGHSVLLTCDVDGNPPPEISWTHGRDKV